MVKPLLTGGNRIAELTSTRHVDRYVWSSSPQGILISMNENIFLIDYLLQHPVLGT